MIISQLVLRFQSLNEIFNIFSPILNFEDLTTTEIHEKCSVLINRYPKVFTSSLSDEIVHLKAVFKSTFTECSESKLVSNKLLNKIYDYHLESVFPEVCLGLRICWCLPVTIAESERSFSKLNIIKNHLRSTMVDERLNGLAMLSIENQLTKTINFENVIKDFASMKVRRLM